MVTSGYQFMNLPFVHLSKNLPTEHQLLVRVLAYRKYRRRQPRKQYLYYGTFVTNLKRVVKWTKNNLLHHVPAFWSHLFWNGKRKQARIYKLYHLFTQKIPKNMKWDENETLHWIMRWGWMRWKWNLAFNNDDGKKIYTENYLQNTIYKNYLHKKNK